MLEQNAESTLFFGGFPWIWIIFLIVLICIICSCARPFGPVY